MANLKDTIVLGNLTVTGKVVASDILANGTGNEFDTIKVNVISAKDNTTIEMCDILNEINWSLGTTGILTLNSPQVAPPQADGGHASNLGGPGRLWSWMFSNYLTTNYIYAQSILPRYSGTGTESTTIAQDNTGSIGSSTNRWYQAHINDVRAYNGNYYVSLSASGLSVSTSSISPNIGSSSVPFNNVYGKNFYASSDVRLKDNISKSNINYYDIINKIQLVNYTWKSDEQHILHHGLIAQQLKEVLPEELHNHLISESAEEDEKMMSVNDGKLVYFALGALQQQLQINNKLEQRIQKLEELLRGDN